MRAGIIATGAVVIAAVLGAGPSAADEISFTTVKLPNAGATEPRVDVGPDNTLYAVANQGNKFGFAFLYSSHDHGQTWVKAPSRFAGQVLPTPDLDVAALPDGSVVMTELDSSLSFPTGVTTDGGRTWKSSIGSNQLPDLDRQWIAYGPRNARTGKYEVYMIFHNLLSGFALHNMFVATSVDGGHTFGPPVPITVPGTDAWLDLQCADSGGPTGIIVNHRTNELYALWRSRSYSLAGINTGGCGASLFQKLEINIIASTRIWVAHAKLNQIGAWKSSLAVDASQQGHIVAMQNLQASLDNAGNMWVGYVESPHRYPDFSGAAVKLTHAPPNLSSWSRPLTLVPTGGAGSILTHTMAGDPGKVAVAYFKGQSRPGKKPLWRLHVASTFNALDASPAVSDMEVSSVPAEIGTATALMGVCAAHSPIEGVINGFLCDRSSDIWGTTLDRDCRMVVLWPAEVVGPTQGTYASTQSAGPRLCATRRV